jgi:hypothetical protein
VLFNPPDFHQILDKFPDLKKAVPWLIGTVALRYLPTVLRQLLDLIPYAAHTVRRVPIQWRLTGIKGETEILKAKQELNHMRSSSVPFFHRTISGAESHFAVESKQHPYFHTDTAELRGSDGS